MRNYFFIILLFAVCFNGRMVQAQWNAETSPTRENLKGISVTNRGSLWIVGDSGTILYKTDNNWQIYPKPTHRNLTSINFISENNGWAVGAKGTIIHFDGLKWDSFPSPTKNNLYSVSFKDKDNGAAVGEAGTILIFSNGIWRVLEKKQVGNFNTATYENNNIWLGGGLECVSFPIMKILTSRNDEFTLVKDANSFASINSIFFINSVSGWAVGSPSTILHYDGQNWQKQGINEKFSSLDYIYFSDENSGISVGRNGTILSFSDKNWIKEASGVSHNLKGAAINGNTFYAIGDSGTILSKILVPTNDNSLTNMEGSQQTNTNPNASYGLSPISENELFKIELLPNPSDKLLTVKLFSEHKFDAATIIVTNINGQVMLLKETGLIDTNFSYLIETEYFESGAYMLNLILGGKSYTYTFIVKH